MRSVFLINRSPDYYKPKLYPVGYDYLEKRDIILGMPTNILCVDDRRAPDVDYEILDYDYYKTKLIIQDFTATLYLGKIIFKKNKQSNLAPIYIPSKITESSFEGLNTFWLNEINPNAKKPFKPLIVCHSNEGCCDLEPFKCKIDKTAIPHQKIYYYRSKDNIVLSKEQIISYFTELHKPNTSFIQSYIDSINQEQGIKASYLHSDLYKILFNQGVLSRDMLNVDIHEEVSARKEGKLIALDYLKSTNQYNSKILFFNELFYAYLVWSLKEYLIADNPEGYGDLLLNTGAYKKEIRNTLEQEGKKPSGFYLNRLFYSGHKYKFLSPNQVPIPGVPVMLGDKLPSRPPNFYTYKPSPLGNYYFELEDNENTFVEYFQKIYPKLDNPPKGWSKEMMKKLDIKLEA